jgi:hypothetical protein
MSMDRYLRNPRLNLYRWELEEAIQHIRDGFAHGFHGYKSMHKDMHPELVDFHNRDFGQRLATATLIQYDEFKKGNTHNAPD